MLAGPAAIALVAAGPAAPDPVRGLAGRYDFVIDEPATGRLESVAEVVPVDANRAYVRVVVNAPGGFSCDVHGLARGEGRALVLRKPATRIGPACTLRISRTDDVLDLDDGERSCRGWCGVNADFSATAFDWNSRRPIRYLDRLKRSREYREAVAAPGK